MAVFAIFTSPPAIIFLARTFPGPNVQKQFVASGEHLAPADMRTNSRASTLSAEPPGVSA